MGSYKLMVKDGLHMAVSLHKIIFEVILVPLKVHCIALLRIICIENPTQTLPLLLFRSSRLQLHHLSLVSVLFLHLPHSRSPFLSQYLVSKQ